MHTTTASLKLHDEGQANIPIKLVLIKNRKYARIHTNKYCAKADWDADKELYKRHNDKNRANAELRAYLNLANENLERIDREHPFATVLQIKKLLEPILKGNVSVPSEYACFIQASEIFIARINNESTKAHYQDSFLAVKKFLDGKQLLFSNVDYSFLRDFEAWALSTPTKTKGVRSKSSVNGYLRDIRAVWNDAKKSAAGERRKWLDENYPFNTYSLPKPSKGKRVTYQKSELDIFRTAELKLQSHIDARDAWLLEYNIMGTRIRDILTLEWEEVFNGYIDYDMNKTGHRKKFVLPDEAAAIISKHEEWRGKRKYVLPFIKSDTPTLREIKSATKRINDNLEIICKRLGIPRMNTHGARRTLGKTLLDSGVSIIDLQGVFGHEDIETTIGSYTPEFDYNKMNDFVKILNNKKASPK